MERKKLISFIELYLGEFLIILVGYGWYLGHAIGVDRFMVYVEEDGLVENLTALFLFLGSQVCLYRVLEYWKTKKPLWIFTNIVLTLLFFFAAGEEISWGQRIFGIESSEFFLEHNKQAETNLHNLMIGDTNLNILIFSQLMLVVLIVYFVFLRPLVSRVAFFRKLAFQFRVPMPKIQHIVIFFVSNIMVLLIGLKKESELHELSFAVIFFLILLNPLLQEKA